LRAWVPLSGRTAIAWSSALKARPREIVVGLFDVRVVEPISNVVLEVDEYRHTETAGLSSGQFANFARFAGRDAAPAGCAATDTSSDATTTADAEVHLATRRSAVPLALPPW
jgi:hypothetical protein